MRISLGLATFATGTGAGREAWAQPIPPGWTTPQQPLSPLYPPGQSYGQSFSHPGSPAAGPTYRITGYERREEALSRPSDIRALLGPAGYRQYMASRALLIIGGVAAFSGAIALLATFGSMAQSSNYGVMSLGPYANNYKPYVYGFSGLLAAGSGIVVTGLILSLPLPPRKRTLLLPHLQIVETPRL